MNTIFLLFTVRSLVICPRYLLQTRFSRVLSFGFILSWFSPLFWVYMIYVLTPASLSNSLFEHLFSAFSQFFSRKGKLLSHTLIYADVWFVHLVITYMWCITTKEFFINVPLIIYILWYDHYLPMIFHHISSTHTATYLMIIIFKQLTPRMWLDNFIWTAQLPKQVHSGGQETSSKKAANLIISSSASL